MRFQVPYIYTAYRYSKRATQYSEAASLFRTFAILGAIASTVSLIFDFNTQGEVILNICIIVACVLYVILYYAVIRDEIDKIALEDYEKMLQQQKQNPFDR